MVYGTMQRRMTGAISRQLGVGATFGLGGIIVMAQPILLGPGLQADARGAFVGMAAAFGGPIAAVISATLMIAVRIFIGGGGTAAGAAVIAVTALGALLWRYRMGGRTRCTRLEWLTICLICAIPSAFTLFAFTGKLSGISMFLGTVISLVVFIFGTMLETEQRRGRRERELARKATTDFLTDLPNRRSFQEYAHRLERERATGVLFLLLDVDHFKKINDELGHSAGDAVLREIGSLIRQTVRDTDFAARIGGEEFAIIVRTRSTLAGRLIAERFQTALRVPVGLRRQANVSVGAFFFDREPFAFAEAYDRADTALYQSKAMGRDRVTFYKAGEPLAQLAAEPRQPADASRTQLPARFAA